MPPVVIVFIALIVDILLTFAVMAIVENRKDDTPMWEVALVCLLFTPIIGLIVEMLKPYKPTYQPIEKPKDNYIKEAR